jgi:hypothetical protein
VPPASEDQVIDFYHDLFDRIFSTPFRSQIPERLKRNHVVRQVEEAADAASQSLARFLLTQRCTPQEAADLLGGLAGLAERLSLDDVVTLNATPEVLAEELLAAAPCPAPLTAAGRDPVYRVALHAVVQVLMLVGPVMAEWQRLRFSSTFELPRRVVNRLNEISQQLDALGLSGQSAADHRYELTYRDYLLQRFHRVEAGTIRMATNLAVDLSELFVMPRVRVHSAADAVQPAAPGTTDFMNLAVARTLYNGHSSGESALLDPEDARRLPTALEQIHAAPRLVLLGAPGSGKSTLLEWLQLQVAAVEEELIAGDQQAIPLLLRVRQLDPCHLPRGAELIELVTASKDRAALMPRGWLQRQLRAGRVLFMLDGLDEIDPAQRDAQLLPWLAEFCRQYPHCRYVVSARPAGYVPGVLQQLDFVECELQELDDAQVREFTRHWSVAVRLARNEPEAEARREGAVDGERIAAGFQAHPYIRHLARNPLMLSAICLVNYFEGSDLPQERALLYRLCVEGLLHNWDRRRGIRSEYSFDEKLRVCREVALAMQADDRAEYETDRVLAVVQTVLADPARAGGLLEHIRYRTGLLLERRPGVFAFAHLTFQEYLAARAVYEGNWRDIDVEHLLQALDDGRWQEVIPLYCGLAPAPAARALLELLLAVPVRGPASALPDVLLEAFAAAGPEIAEDDSLRQRVFQRVAAVAGGINLVVPQHAPQQQALFQPA